MSGPLSPVVRGVLWMTAAMFAFTIVTVTIRELMQSFPALEVVLFRSVLGLVFLAPWLYRAGLVELRTRRWGLYLVRAAVLLGAQLTWYFAVSEIPLADATALHFTLPLFGVILAVVVLGERAGPYRWLATAVGFAGALVIVRPGFAAVEPAAVAALVSAGFYAGNGIATKSLLRTEPVNRVLFHGFFLSVVVALIYAPFDWVTPGWQHAPTIATLGVAGFIAQWCSTYAMKLADVSLLAPLDYIRLPFAAILGFVLYLEVPDPWMWLGAAIIVGSTYAVARREARAAHPGGA